MAARKKSSSKGQHMTVTVRVVGASKGKRKSPRKAAKKRCACPKKRKTTHKRKHHKAGQFKKGGGRYKRSS